MEPFVRDADFTAEQLALIRSALIIPTCWNPRVRDEALTIVEAAIQRMAQHSLLTETAA